MAWVALTSPFSLKNGAQYSAAIHLSWGEKLIATNPMVAQKFKAAGFDNVTCALNGATGTVEGSWPGPDTDGVALPSEVTTVWQWMP